MKPTSVHLIGFFLGLLAVVTVSAQDDPDLNRPSLKGIKGVRVGAGVSKDIEEAGLRTDLIKTDAELKLRQAGIPVLETAAELASTPGSPSLFVDVEGVATTKAKDPVLYGFHLSVTLSQFVLLERDPSLRPTGQFRSVQFDADTWSISMVGVQVSNPSDTIRSTVKDLVDKFIDAYLAANQKNQQ